MKLIESITNIKGDTYELFLTGKSFVSVVHYVERKNKKATLAPYTETKRHRTYDNALNSKQRYMFKGPMIKSLV